MMTIDPQTQKHVLAIELAWGIIANAGGGNWESQTPEWQAAATRWRDEHFGPITPVLAEQARARDAMEGASHLATPAEAPLARDADEPRTLLDALVGEMTRLTRDLSHVESVRTVRASLDAALAELVAEHARARAVSIAYQSGLDYDDDHGVWCDEGGAVMCLDEHLVEWISADARTASRAPTTENG